jgi:nitrile hydratase
VLGLPPSWYKSREYRSRTVREPRAVLREFGTEIPASVELRVHDSTADMRYLVLPMRPKGAEKLDAEQLAGLVTRDCMIGVAVPQSR